MCTLTADRVSVPINSLLADSKNHFKKDWTKRGGRVDPEWRQHERWMEFRWTYDGADLALSDPEKPLRVQ